jgi:hypothetical protein
VLYVAHALMEDELTCSYLLHSAAACTCPLLVIEFRQAFASKAMRGVGPGKEGKLAGRIKYWSFQNGLEAAGYGLIWTTVIAGDSSTIIACTVLLLSVKLINYLNILEIYCYLISTIVSTDHTALRFRLRSLQHSPN